jgi:type I restriction enzyme M protein
MPSGVFEPYAGVSTAVLLFTKTNSGGTDDVWFYDIYADGFSLHDKRTPQPDKSDLPDLLNGWHNRAKEKGRKRIDQSFLVPKSELAAKDYDLSINRYKGGLRSRRIRLAEGHPLALGEAGGGD